MLTDASNNAVRWIALGAALAVSVALVRGDIVYNGNFASTSLPPPTTDYTLGSPGCGGATPNPTYGEYYIGTNPNTCNGGWESMGDPFADGGNMMILNSSTTADADVWSEMLSSTSGTEFTFTFWLADIDDPQYNSIPAVLEFLVNGVAVSGCTDFENSTSGTWAEETCNYVSAGSTETLELINTNTKTLGEDGDDFAIDNISDPPATGVPEPSGAAGLMVALAVLTFSRRRMRSA